MCVLLFYINLFIYAVLVDFLLYMAVIFIKDSPFCLYQDLNFLLKQFRVNFWSVPVNNQDAALLTLTLVKTPGHEKVFARHF